MPISQDAVRDGWIALLSRYSWDWFVTITFRGDYVHPESADKRWRLWCSILNRQLYGPRWYKKGKEIHWVRALELQKRGVIHYHALMTHPHDLNQLFSRMGQVNDLETIAGFSRIYPPRCNEAVTRYCAKYVIKGGELDVSPLPGTSRSIDKLTHGIRNVAALYCRKDSIYKSFPGVDAFDLERDARNFDLSMPVVAHPPFRGWGTIEGIRSQSEKEKRLLWTWLCGSLIWHAGQK